jgi:hypothetical protein
MILFDEHKGYVKQRHAFASRTTANDDMRLLNRLAGNLSVVGPSSRRFTTKESSSVGHVCDSSRCCIKSK